MAATLVEATNTHCIDLIFPEKHHIYYKELAHTIMEAEKSKICNSQVRKADDIVPVQVQIQRQEKIGAQLQKRQRKNSFLLSLLFYLGPQWIG